MSRSIVLRPDNVVDALRDADVAVALRERTRYDANVLNQMPNLKLIVSVGGRENPSIDKDVAIRRGVLVCYTAGAVSDGLPPSPPGNPSMTEMALGMMISVMRGFGVQDRRCAPANGRARLDGFCTARRSALSAWDDSAAS